MEFTYVVLFKRKFYKFGADEIAAIEFCKSKRLNPNTAILPQPVK